MSFIYIKLGFLLELLNGMKFNFGTIVIDEFGVSLEVVLSLTDFLFELQDFDSERLYCYDLIRVDINLLFEIFIVYCWGFKVEILHC